MTQTPVRTGHWAAQRERGSEALLSLSVWLSRHCPRALLHLCTGVVVSYFYLTSAQARRCIGRYQQRLKAHEPGVKLPARFAVWRQFLAFGMAIVDRFGVWQGRIAYEDLDVEDPDGVYDDIRASSSQVESASMNASRSDTPSSETPSSETPSMNASRSNAPSSEPPSTDTFTTETPPGESASSASGARPKGQLMVCSHVGNIEICRALAQHNRGFVLNILVHSRHTEKFNRALRQAGASDIRLIQVTDLDLDLMMRLHERLDAGEWLAIAADRVPVRGEKTVPVNFLGNEALLPQGPWLLAGLLGVPINLVFCTWQSGRYRLRLEKFSEAPHWSRSERNQAVAALAQRFADRLALVCREVPLQWFNFYDFWGDDAH